MEGALLDPHKAGALLERADRSVFAVSYGWLSPHRPDPGGVRLTQLLRYLRSLRTAGKLPEGAGLFWDFGVRSRTPRSIRPSCPAVNGLRPAVLCCPC